MWQPSPPLYALPKCCSVQAEKFWWDFVGMLFTGDLGGSVGTAGVVMGCTEYKSLVARTSM